MKIFTSAQIHELDKYTIEHEPISSLNLMERAAKALTRAIEEEWANRTPVVVSPVRETMAAMRLLWQECSARTDMM